MRNKFKMLNYGKKKELVFSIIFSKFKKQTEKWLRSPRIKGILILFLLYKTLETLRIEFKMFKYGELKRASF